MGDKRAPLEIDDIDLENLSGPSKNKKVDPVAVKKASEDSGFPSRSPRKRQIRRRRMSPYQAKKLFSTRPGMNDLIIEIGELLGLKDCEVLDQAILSLTDRPGLERLKTKAEKLIKS